MVPPHLVGISYHIGDRFRFRCFTPPPPDEQCAIEPRLAARIDPTIEARALSAEYNTHPKGFQAATDTSGTIGRRSQCGVYGTRKDTLLESVRLGVTTSIFPVVAPVGTVAVFDSFRFSLEHERRSRRQH